MFMIMSDLNSHKRRKMINNIHIHVCIVPKLKVKQRFWILTMKIHFIKIDLTTKWEYSLCKIYKLTVVKIYTGIMLMR